jgi:hypothetical protein
MDGDDAKKTARVSDAHSKSLVASMSRSRSTPQNSQHVCFLHLFFSSMTAD